MDLNLNDKQLDAIISKAILDSLTTETREELLTKAVKDTLTRPEKIGNYSDGRSQLQKAFDRSVERVADQLIREELSQDTEFKSKVQELFKDVATALFDGENRSSMVEMITTAIIKGLNPRDY